jgi:hypothetical protein
VNDLIAANVEIFSPGSSTCRQVTPGLCGNSALDPGEACDDGARCSNATLCVGGSTPGSACSFDWDCADGGRCLGAACDATAPNTCGVSNTCNRVGLDGCNTACRIESGWICSGSPSVCVRG